MSMFEIFYKKKLKQCMCFITLLQLHKTSRINKAVLTLKFFLRSFHLPYINYHLYLGMLGFCYSIFRESFLDTPYLQETGVWSDWLNWMNSTEVKSSGWAPPCLPLDICSWWQAHKGQLYWFTRVEFEEQVQSHLLPLSCTCLTSGKEKQLLKAE